MTDAGMHARMERFNGGGVIRVFWLDKDMGDPYSYSIAFRFNKEDHTKVEFVGVTKPPSLAQARAIMQCLEENGLGKAKRLRGEDFKEGEG